MSTKLYEVPIVHRQRNRYELVTLLEQTSEDIVNLIGSEKYLWIGTPILMSYLLEDKRDYCEQFGSE
jgi:hypothetical protein